MLLRLEKIVGDYSTDNIYLKIDEEQRKGLRC